MKSESIVKFLYKCSLLNYAENYLDNKRTGDNLYKSLADTSKGRVEALGVVLDKNTEQIDTDLANAVETLVFDLEPAKKINNPKT